MTYNEQQIICSLLFKLTFSYLLIKQTYRFISTLQYLIIQPTTEWKKETIWITGASSGIGESLAQKFAKYKSILILTSRRIEDLYNIKCNLISKQNLQEENIQLLPLDLSNYKESYTKIHDFLNNNKITETTIIANAGISQRSLDKDFSYECIKYMIDVNLLGAILTFKSIYDQQKGNIKQLCAIGSLSSLIPVGIRSCYCASKFALKGQFDSLRIELNNTSITMIYPGYIRTKLSVNSLVGGDLNKLGVTDSDNQNGKSSDALADAILWSIHSKKT